MKRSIIYILLSVLIWGCVNAQDQTLVKVPAPKAGQAVATFGGGCFWAMSEAMSELKGVDQVISGFAGGNTKNPTYEEVCTRTTNHAETVQIYYDPKVITYAQLVEAFLYAHNPTELNYQGPDEGTDYRSVAFYRTPEEKATLLDEIKKVNATKHYNAAIVTQVVPFTAFYGAEKYHQGYYRIHPESGYIQGVSVPKVMKMRQAVPTLLKPEFKKNS